MRACPPGRPADRGRAALRPLSSSRRHDLRRLRPDSTLRDLPGYREAVVPGLPAPAGPRARPAAATSAIASGTLDRPLCAGCTPPPPWASCPVCSDPDHPSPGQCARCLINARLDDLMGPDDGSLPPGLQALRREIAAAEHTITATRWLAKPSVAPVLSGLADGSIPLTHQALDALPQRPALAYLRQTLVATGALPSRDEEMIRLETFLHGLLDSQADPERRRLLHRYLIWHLVRRLRSRNNGKPVTRQQALLTRRLARGAIAFLDWLDSAGLTLGNCQQADLDRWLASGQAVYREEAGRLIRWAHAAGLTSCYLLSAARWTGPAAVLDGENRWDIARRLLHDDALKPEDRLAGLLVLLYAQGVTAISRMTASQVHAGDDGTVRLQLGRVPVQLPDPVASIALAVAANRKGHATIGAADRHPGCSPEASPAGRSAAPAHPTARRTRDQPPPGPQHGPVPARRRDPRRHPRPHPRHQHQRRRHLAAPVRRRLGRLRRRRQPPLPAAARPGHVTKRRTTSRETTPLTNRTLQLEQAFRQFQ